MTPAQRVLAIHPKARAISRGLGKVEIWANDTCLGAGANEPTAWIDAADNLATAQTTVTAAAWNSNA